MKIKIASPSGIGATTRVDIDGEPCRLSKAVRFEAHVDKVATVSLDVYPLAFEYEGEAIVSVGEETAALLRKLGWREPEPVFKDEDKVPDEGTSAARLQEVSDIMEAERVRLIGVGWTRPAAERAAIMLGAAALGRDPIGAEMEEKYREAAAHSRDQ